MKDSKDIIKNLRGSADQLLEIGDSKSPEYKKGQALLEWLGKVETALSSQLTDIYSLFLLLVQDTYSRGDKVVPISYYEKHDSEQEIHQQIIKQIQQLQETVLPKISQDLRDFTKKISDFLEYIQRSFYFGSEQEGVFLRDEEIVERYFLEVYDHSFNYSLSLPNVVSQELKIDSTAEVNFKLTDQFWLLAGLGSERAIPSLYSIPQIKSRVDVLIKITEEIEATPIGLLMLGLLHDDSKAHNESHFLALRGLIANLEIDFNKPILKLKDELLTFKEFLIYLRYFELYPQLAKTKLWLTEMLDLLQAQLPTDLPDLLPPASSPLTRSDKNFLNKNSSGSNCEDNLLDLLWVFNIKEERKRATALKIMEKYFLNFYKKRFDDYDEISFDFAFVHHFSELKTLQSHYINELIYEYKLKISFINYVWYNCGFYAHENPISIPLLKKFKNYIPATHQIKDFLDSSKIAIYRLGFLLLGLIAGECSTSKETLQGLSQLLMETGVSLEEVAFEIDSKKISILDMIGEVKIENKKMQDIRNWLLSCGAMPNINIESCPPPVGIKLESSIYSFASLSHPYQASLSLQAFCWKKRLYTYQLPSAAFSMVKKIIENAIFQEFLENPLIWSKVIEYMGLDLDRLQIQNYSKIQNHLKGILGMKTPLEFEKNWAVLFPKKPISQPPENKSARRYVIF